MAEMMKEVVVVEPHKYEVREVEIPITAPGYYPSTVKK